MDIIYFDNFILDSIVLGINIIIFVATIIFINLAIELIKIFINWFSSRK